MHDPLTNVFTIDCQYTRPLFAAAYLLIQKDEATFVDNNTAHCVPLLISQLKESGLGVENVRYIIITHVHLDHAGGSSALMELCPNATLLAHPRAARHLIDPSRLVASAKQVYGEAEFERLYGELKPVAPGRVKTLDDSESLIWGNRELRFLHTRGHANHHFCVQDVALSAVFTGDAFGLCYPELQDQGLFILPSTSPTDFDPDEAMKSIDRIVATGAKCVYPTHYGKLTQVAKAADQLKEHLEFYKGLLSVEPGEMAEKQRGHFENYLKKRKIRFSAEQWSVLEMDLELNVAGVAYAAKRLKEKSKT